MMKQNKQIGINPVEARNGLAVNYHPTIIPNEPVENPFETYIIGQPWQLPGGTWVVKLAGLTGGCALSHLEKR